LGSLLDWLRSLISVEARVNVNLPKLFTGTLLVLVIITVDTNPLGSAKSLTPRFSGVLGSKAIFQPLQAVFSVSIKAAVQNLRLPLVRMRTKSSVPPEAGLSENRPLRRQIEFASNHLCFLAVYLKRDSRCVTTFDAVTA
jgi:hypothetical protein